MANSTTQTAEAGGNGQREEGAPTPPFSSKLQEGKQRFLAHAIEHSLEVGRRTAADFIRHFPPRAIMEGLANRPSIRSEILVHTTGTKKKIAAKKSWESAGEDLQIALDESETNADTIVSVFDADDRVRYLDDKKIWTFLTEGEFWKATPGKKEEYRIAKKHMAFLLERALTDQLTTHRDIVEGITVAEMAVRLPKAELGKIIEGALSAGRSKSPFTEAELLTAMPPEVLVEYVPLPHLYEKVIVPKVAEPHGYVEPPQQAAEPAGAAAAEPEPEPEPEPEREPEAAAATTKESKAPESQDWEELPEDAEGDEEAAEDEISDDDFAPA